MFKSEVKHVGAISFPDFSGIRVMMMPFRMEDVATLPDSLAGYRETVGRMVGMARVHEGVGYLTADEAMVRAGEAHRRPGLHVDGLGVWGGGGGSWAAKGMLLTSSVVGCRGYAQDFSGDLDSAQDNCEHLRPECLPSAEIVMQPSQVYWCGALTVHESMVMSADCRRQLVRLSMPSDAPWFEGYTVNPNGILPNRTDPSAAHRVHGVSALKRETAYDPPSGFTATTQAAACPA